MPYHLALDQETLHAIHDVRVTLRRIGRLSDDELRNIRDVAEGRSGYDSLDHEGY